MRVLDIDMDFFLNKIFNWGTFTDTRLPDDEYKPWSIDRVEKFLEYNCGLRKDRKINGQMFTQHKEVFYFWRQLISTSDLSIPFDVVHVDAHADLGGGDASWKFIFEQVLNLPVEERYSVEQYKYRHEIERLESGNYLLYAMACDWVDSLTYVHPFISDGKDYYPLLMKNSDDNSGYIQMKRFDAQINPDVDLLKQHFESINEIKFVIVNDTEYINNREFDFVTFCQSPSFTPKSADFIMDVIKDYIDII